MNYLTSWAMALWNLEDASFATASVLQSKDVDSSDVCLPGMTFDICDGFADIC
jgi:hypothetical protein